MNASRWIKQIGATVYTAVLLTAVQVEATSTLYGVDNSTDQLITINTTTGAATVVGSLGFSIVRGLAFDPNTSTLYGVDALADQLITINTTTGAGTAVGPLGFDAPTGLTFTAAASPVPEPSTFLLLGTGLVGLAGYGRRKQKA